MNPITGAQMYTFHNCQLGDMLGYIDQNNKDKCDYLKCLISIYLERLDVYFGLPVYTK